MKSIAVFPFVCWCEFYQISNLINLMDIFSSNIFLVHHNDFDQFPLGVLCANQDSPNKRYPGKGVLEENSELLP